MTIAFTSESGVQEIHDLNDLKTIDWNVGTKLESVESEMHELNELTGVNELYEIMKLDIPNAINGLKELGELIESDELHGMNPVGMRGTAIQQF